MVFPSEVQAQLAWFITTRSVTQVQRNVQNAFYRVPPSQPAIRRWHKKMPSIWMLKEGNWKHIAQKFHTIKPPLSEDNVEPVCAAYLQSPRLLELHIQSKILYQRYKTSKN